MPHNQATPPFVCDGGKLNQCTKSDLLTCLEEFCSAQNEPPMDSGVTVEKVGIVQMLHPKGVRIFTEYTLNVYIPYIMLKLCNVQVWTLCMIGM